jgi:hypothetical protein
VYEVGLESHPVKLVIPRRELARELASELTLWLLVFVEMVCELDAIDVGMEVTWGLC